MIRYRLHMEPDDNGTILVTSPDLPIVTYGDSEAEAHRNAADAINVVLDTMLRAREPVPTPTLPDEVGVPFHAVSLQTELKIRLHQAMLEAGMSRADLQRKLAWQRESVDRLFRIDHASRIEQLEQAFAATGKAVSVELKAAA